MKQETDACLHEFKSGVCVRNTSDTPYQIYKLFNIITTLVIAVETCRKNTESHMMLRGSTVSIYIRSILTWSLCTTLYRSRLDDRTLGSKAQEQLGFVGFLSCTEARVLTSVVTIFLPSRTKKYGGVFFWRIVDKWNSIPAH